MILMTMMKMIMIMIIRWTLTNTIMIMIMMMMMMMKIHWNPWSADTSNLGAGTQIFISGIILRAGWPFRGGMQSCYENENDDDGDDVVSKGH